METQTRHKLKPRIERFEKVWTPDVRLIIPHENKEVVFAYPPFGSGPCLGIGKEILNCNLRIPTAEQTASLLYTAYFDDNIKNEPEFKDIREVMRKVPLWVFNRNLWTEKGVYVIQLDGDEMKKLLGEELEQTKIYWVVLGGKNEKGINKPLDENELEKLLKEGEEINGVKFSKDKKVRFAPKETYNYNLRVGQTYEQFAENGFIIASFGKEGAEKLAEVFTGSRKLLSETYIRSLPDIKENENPILGVSTIEGGFGGFSFGGNWGELYFGHAFGVLK